MNQFLSVLDPPPDVRRAVGRRGPFRILSGPSGPVVSFISRVSIPWNGGLKSVISTVSDLVGNDSPRTYCGAITLFDSIWAASGGEVRIGFDIEEDLFGRTLVVKNLFVPPGWWCEKCGGAVEDAAYCMSHRAMLPCPVWDRRTVCGLEFDYAVVCSGPCLDAAAEECNGAIRCQSAKLARLARAGAVRARAFATRRRTRRCSA